MTYFFLYIAGELTVLEVIFKTYKVKRQGQSKFFFKVGVALGKMEVNSGIPCYRRGFNYGLLVSEKLNQSYPLVKYGVRSPKFI